jgi:serine/threonine protein kinase
MCWHLHLYCLPCKQGTPGYCAPEVLSGTWRSHPTACDAYAIGAMLVELLSGAIPDLYYRDPESGAVRPRVRARWQII